MSVSEELRQYLKKFSTPEQILGAYNRGANAVCEKDEQASDAAEQIILTALTEYLSR